MTRVTLLCGFAAFTLSAPGYAQTPQLHVVPTNLPGVHAFTQPPAGFDARTAPSVDLESWGYPPRPDPSVGPQAQADWLRTVNPAVRRVVPNLVQKPGVYHRPASALKLTSIAAGQKNATATSSNWSGYALYSASLQYNSVSASWIVPAVQQAPGTCDGGWDYSSQWVGIDGFGNSQLLQAGTQAMVYCNSGVGPSSVQEYVPWIEWLPNSEITLETALSKPVSAIPVQAGDYVTVTVTATNFSAGKSTSGIIVFVDNTQGWGFSIGFTASALGGTYVSGQSAEWIVERPEVGGSFATLPDYFADPFYGSTATRSGVASHYTPGIPGTATAYNITMVDNSNNPVSYVQLFVNSALWFFPEGSAVK